MEQVKELCEQLKTIKGIIGSNRHISTYVRGQQDNVIDEMMKYIIKDCKSYQKIINDYRNNHYKNMSLKRTLLLGDILIPRMKEIHLVEKVLNMSRDMENEDFNKLKKKYSNKISTYRKIWVITFIESANKQINAFETRGSIVNDTCKYLLNGEEVKPNHLFNKLIGRIYPKKEHY